MTVSEETVHTPPDELSHEQPLIPSSSTTESIHEEYPEPFEVDDSSNPEPEVARDHDFSQQDETHDPERDDLRSLTDYSCILIRDATNRLNEPNSDNDGKDSQKTYRRDPFYYNWGFEVLLLIFAAALFSAICLTLNKYDEQELPSWDNIGITLNTLIATLSTIFRAVLALVAFEVLAQLKWDWASDRFRPMQDIQLFDDASRGIYGSLRLLPLIALREPLALGAIVIATASLGIGPFVQQTVQTYQCRRSADSVDQIANIKYAKNVDRTDLMDPMHGGYYHLKIGLETAMQDSIVNPSNDSNIGSFFTCSTGNCTFATYGDTPNTAEEDKVSHVSVGMCSRCEDVYDLVQGPELDETEPTMKRVVFNLPVYHPSGLDLTPMQLRLGATGTFTGDTLLVIRMVGNLTWTRTAVPPEFLNRARWSVANLTILAASQDHCEKLSNGTVSCPSCDPEASEDICSSARTKFGEADYVAATYILYPCINYYSAVVEGGILSEKVIRDVPLRPQLFYPGPIWSAQDYASRSTTWQGVQQPCWVNGTLYTSSNISKAEASLGPNSTALVQFHMQDWAEENIDSQAEYINITAPLECIAELPDALPQHIAFKIDQTFNTSCSFPSPLEGTAFTCNASQSAHLVAFMRDNVTSVDTIRETVESLSMRLTTEMRKVGRGPYLETNAVVKGEAWENRSCVHVAWKWLALPASIFVLCTAVLACIIAKEVLSKDGLVWKASILPFLLKDQAGLQMVGLKGVEDLAKELEVKIQKQRNTED